MIIDIASRNFLQAFLAASVLLGGPSWALADSSSPHLAAFYQRNMLVCGETAYQWEGTGKPEAVASDAIQVGVGRSASYVLTNDGVLRGWGKSPATAMQLLDRVKWFAAGRSGVFAIRNDDSLWHIARSKSWFGDGDVVNPVRIDDEISAAAIGDSANYYVTRAGVLHVRGLAHRGQYGDGKLKSTDNFIPVAKGVESVKAHTGHAIFLNGDGVVMGTGGNIYGPLGRHGLGDKAISWGAIFEGAASIATGSSHTAALRADGSLWMWGRDIGLEPVRVMDNILAVAADSSGTLALDHDGTLWQWDRDEQPKRLFDCPQ